MKSEKGISLIETIIAVVILSIISASFLGALATTSSARAINEERTAAKILAETILENIKTENYSISYNAAIPDEFPGYSANVSAIAERNGNIQKIVITVLHNDEYVLNLESYKVDRTR